MSESIAEMVIPGTYIEVRAEGLIAVGGISTGNIGIVGTAGRGPVGAAVPVGSYAQAVEAFGGTDAFAAPRVADRPLTLVRALEQAFNGGARNIFAVRVANGTPTAATLAVRAAGDTNGFTLSAKGQTDAEGDEIAATSGTWGRDTTVDVVADSSSGAVRWRMTLANGARREVYEGANVGEVHTQLGASALVTAGAVSNAGKAFDPISGPWPAAPTAPTSAPWTSPPGWRPWRTSRSTCSWWPAWAPMSSGRSYWRTWTARSPRVASGSPSLVPAPRGPPLRRRAWRPTPPRQPMTESS